MDLSIRKDMVSVGDVAPDFTLMANDRSMVTLSDSIGNKVILAFYPAAFTGVCTTEMCTFTDSMSKFDGLEVEVFGISVDSIFSNNEFANNNSIGFPLLSDVNREATNSYGVGISFVMPGYVASQRSVFIIDEDGRIGYVWVAENPGIEPNYQEIIDFCKN
jgi:peroxiredoxin